MNKAFVRVSKKDPRYFELSDGSPYIPVGMNICFQRFLTNPDEIMAVYERQMKALSENGANYLRIWLSAPVFEVEPEKPGVFDMAALGRVKKILAMAEKYGIRIKFTFEHFRTMEAKAFAELFPGAASFVKKVHHVSNGGTASTMEEFFTGEASRAAFKKKLAFFSEHIGDNPYVFSWELWNEVNCMPGGIPVVDEWTKIMLAELRTLFPHHMTSQNLGSFDSIWSYPTQEWMASLKDNSFMQAHRYLDPAAEIDACRGAMDILASNAIEELIKMKNDVPALLTESGAVEWCHCRPSHLYEYDKIGSILHDVIFAPFFAGSAGTGQIWHWHEYVDKYSLWHHFGSFARMIKGIDPVSEAYSTYKRENRNMRIYGLRGRTHSLVWLRDKNSTWYTEFDRKTVPSVFSREKFSVKHLPESSIGKVSFLNPWTLEEAVLELKDGEAVLPDFSRSLVLRIEH